MSEAAAPPSPAPERPLLVYDGNCGFCLRWILRARRCTADRVDYAPSQRAAADPRVHDVPADEFRRSVVLFEPGGRVSRAAEAALRALSHAPRRGWGLPLLLYRTIPGIAPLCETAYRFVASRRDGVLRLERLLIGDVVTPAFQRSRALFRRGLALVALIAFLSLWVQIDGLCGSRGIAPAAEQLARAVQDAADASAAAAAAGLPSSPLWLQRPTLLLLGASDAALHGLCAAGTALSLLLLLDIAPALCALLLWALYLSLLQACAPFLWFQWDTLLIETLLLATWVLPWRLWRAPRTADGRPGDRPPPALARWLLWFLLFRFTFESGVVKLTSGDGCWTDLTALTYHYMTQPLPHLASWFAAHLPLWIQKVSCAGMFAIELAAPFLILLPRRLRHAGCAAMIALQGLIAATGNYGFFNLLTIVLCLSLLDDAALSALSPARLGRRLFGSRRHAAAERVAAVTVAPSTACGVPSATGGELPPWRPEPRAPRLQRWLLAGFAAPVLVVSGLQLHDLFAPGSRPAWDEVQAGVLATLLSDGPSDAARVLEVRVNSCFVSVNSYGLFRVMTRDRPEILVQCSADGEHWVDCEFRWKPGDVLRPPGWAQPHMPRLDWQLWFEALHWQGYLQPLRPYRPSEWFGSFLERLLDGEPAVLGLLARDPLDGAPPVAVRARLFDYRFTTAAERAATGAWWVSQPLYPTWVTLSRESR